MKEKSKFKEKLDTYRKSYLEEESEDPQAEREKEKIKRLDDKIRKKKLKAKKDELEKIKKQENNSNGSQL